MPRLGVDTPPAFYRDPLYIAAVVAGGGFWLGMALWVPVHPLPFAAIHSWPFFTLTCWQPLWEEVLFRGVIQGELRRWAWSLHNCRGVTLANGLTSLLFVLGHLWTHPPLWALAVMIPSLLFGYYRDRYDQLVPSILLHAYYNAGYFLLTGLP